MSVYKVPQDVEADDKLLGPFTFRQFIYLMIVAGSLAVGYVLATQVFIGLALIMLPIIVFFGALALPLKKDQPMETYLAAVVNFYLKPRKRLWKQDGIESLIEITVPKKLEEKRARELSEHEAHRRLSYLADIMDTEGWSVKGVKGPLKEDIYAETMGVRDMLDTAAPEVANLGQMISQSDKNYHEQLMNNIKVMAEGGQPVPAMNKPPVAKMFQPQIPDAPPVQAEEAVTESVVDAVIGETEVAQEVIDVASVEQGSDFVEEALDAELEDREDPVPEVVEPKVSDDILRLINNKDLSIETMAKEAHRLEEKRLAEEGEVYVSLR